MKKYISRYRKNNAGTVAVEFGLIVFAFLSIVMATIEAGRFFLLWNGFQYAVEKAARVALVDDSLTESDISDLVATNFDVFLANTDNMTISVNFPTINGVDFVEISGTYPYEVLVPFLPDSWTDFDIAAGSRIPRPDL